MPGNVPRPIPGNHDALAAFRIARSTVRRSGLSGQVIGFDWGALIERLKLRGMWDTDIDRKLSVCEAEMLRVAAEVMDRQADQKDKGTK